MPPRPTSTRRSCARRCSHPEKPTEVDRRERVQQCNSQISRQYTAYLYTALVIIKWINWAETCIRCFFLAGSLLIPGLPHQQHLRLYQNAADRCPSRLGAPLLPSGCAQTKKEQCVEKYGFMAGVSVHEPRHATITMEKLGSIPHSGC